jgi:hypothetical protein
LPNRNESPRPLSGANRRISAGQNGIHARLHQFGRMLIELLVGKTITSEINHEVLPVDEAEPP